MYKKIKIENFRGIKFLEFKDLKQFNLIVGKNNSFKTTLLESIFLLTGLVNPDIPVAVNYFRGFRLMNDQFWAVAFNELDTRLPIKLYGEVIKPKEHRYLTMEPLIESEIPDSSETGISFVRNGIRSNYGRKMSGLSFECSVKKGNEKKSLQFDSTIRWDGKNLHRDAPGDYKSPLQGVYIHTNYAFGEEGARRFNDIQVKKQKEKIIKIVRKVDPGIQDISLGSDNILYCDMGFEELIPVNMVGEGINRLLAIILAIFETSNGVVMIDEVENGLHYSALETLWRAIFEAAREFNVQVFATTHSFENLKAYSSAYDRLAKKNDDLRLFRLEREKDKLDLVSIDHEKLKTALENDLELR